ncbi:hypothetical protein M752DRAFT_275745 [Aspergillus phoenicis ATCC 13157]|uniref:Uncharacterized protein n=1 Tax=Aspergillus phoenicis ATCC 13157 TaxID=1353007 RepID=A0A370PN09_ASPPH|nr:hypothetical protein M752DRAFT_275745 [Aspergillus phoenicis ATCC 13157]
MQFSMLLPSSERSKEANRTVVSDHPAHPQGPKPLTPQPWVGRKGSSYFWFSWPYLRVQNHGLRSLSATPLFLVFWFFARAWATSVNRSVWWVFHDFVFLEF